MKINLRRVDRCWMKSASWFGDEFQGYGYSLGRALSILSARNVKLYSHKKYSRWLRSIGGGFKQDPFDISNFRASAEDGV